MKLGIKRKVKSLRKLKKKSFWRRARPKIKKFLNILLAVALFAALIGSAFKISWLFGMSFVVAFALSIYDNQLKNKPWKPIAVFVAALITRFALAEYVDPIFASKTILDLSVSALVFVAIIVFAWRIRHT